MFWIIPLSREKISVGVVMDTSRYRSLGRSPTEVLNRFLEEQPIMRERLAGAHRVTKVYASGDYSYRNAALCGERWLRAGDAAGFIDPIAARHSRSRIRRPKSRSTNRLARS
jgi:FADH2-dependent halogenase